MGYHRAGFDVVGVDHKPQPRYPFEFIQADALEYVSGHGHEFDAIHASPPCQGYSVMNNLPWLAGKERPLLILPTLEILEASNKPYVLENVMGARYGQRGLIKRGLEEHGLKAGWLCGFTLGLPFPRHRLFATSFLWLAPAHGKHPVFTTHHGHASGWTGFKDQNGNSIVEPGNKGKGAGLRVWQDKAENGTGIGHTKGWRLVAEAMGIDWMKHQELTESIPPAYTKYIGDALMVYSRDGPNGT